MVTIEEILSRIKWDSSFGAANFEIGYYDRVADEIITIPLGALTLDEGGLGATDAEGRRVRIPFHRIRRVYRNYELIWSRDPESTRSGG